MYDPAVLQPTGFLYERLAVALGTPELTTTTITITDYTGDTVSVDYVSLPANRPARYKNFLAIWEASMIPWTDPPIRTHAIDLNNQQGSVTMDGLTIAASTYIVGYSVSSDVRGICASAVLNAGGLRAAPNSVQIGVNKVGSTSLSVRYETLAGYLPHTYDNRVVLYPGYASPYNPPAPIASAAIPTDASTGDVGINGVQIGVGLPYTLVYYMRSSGSDAPTSAAAVLTFDTASLAEQHVLPPNA